ncbi:hypothetical protein PRIC2_014260 [Phytophthora ramorum]
MCLYTFDDPAVGKGGMVSNRVPDDSCPFDALQPDSELVTSLNTASTSWQLGVRLAEAPNNDTKRVQLSSLSTVSARDFFTMAAVSNNTASGSGVTFELVLRRRAQTNHSMTLVSIANEYDNCVDPGLRLDVNEHQVLALIYFLPVLEEGGEAGVEACYEQRLFSVDNSAACQLPPVRDPVEHTPPVQILVALDPSSERGLWKTDFYVSYTDPETMQRVDCEVHDEQHPANTQVLSKLVEGRYRLYLGNSPRNVRSPRERKRLAKARSIQPLGNTSSLNATERLRATLKQKLRSITGPRLPKAMRIFGDNSLSLHIFGITFPPLSEDTPLAYLRSKLADFKEQYGDQLVDYLVNLVQQKSSSSVVVKRSPESSSQSYDLLTPFGQHSKDGDEFTRAALFQGADGATFDLFHFAIYQRVVPKEEVNSIARQWLLPSRQFPSRQQTVRIPEDSLVLLNLTTLHGVFDDLRLELRGLPEFGQLLLFPNKTIVTSDSKDAFRELPVEYQRSIFFRPEPDQNNENLPLPNPVAFSRRLKPYATVSFGISDSLSMRVVNKSEEVAFDIFVAPVNDAPRPRIFELEVRVGIGIPVCLNLTGDDIDGAPVTATPSTGASEADDLLSKFTFSNTTVVTTNRQLLKIVQMPHFGKLFDCNKRCGTLQYDRNNRLSLESSRIYRNSTDATNATHSTSLMYVYRGWGQGKNGNASLVVDELSYQLSDGDPGVFSDVAVVKFVLVDGVNDSHFSTPEPTLKSRFFLSMEHFFSSMGPVGVGEVLLTSKARKKRREKFEQEQQIFQTQVAQNDHEYSVLLMSLADILLEPNLLASISLLESCVTPTSHQSQTDFLRQAFVLRSLLPLLESERQGTRFVFQLMAIEYSEGIGTTGTSQLFFQRQGFLSRSSTASKALACFCRLVGSEWMSAVVSPNDGTKGCYLGDTISGLHNLLDRLAKQVDALPAEIVILSRACVKLFQTADEDEKPRELELDAMHLVFFNHFLGPALMFPQDCVPKFSPSLKQQQILYDVACHIVGFSKHWSNFGSERGEMRTRSSSTDSLLRPFAAETENTAECRHKYEEVLLTISQSSATTSSYDPSHSKADVDCELMGMCLMNMHSLLDSYFPAFKRRLRAHTSMNDDQTEATVTRMARLLQALSWPLASIQELVEYAQPELLKDPLLWSDFSFQEWEDRAAQDRPNLQQPTTDRRITQSHQSLLAQFSSDFILEQDDNSPSDVDWLTS